MKHILILVLFGMQFCAAQNSNPAIESSDPDALSLLEKIKFDYDAFESHLMEFKLTVEFPGEAIQVYNGILLQSGEKFELDLGDKLIISDDTTVWLYLKDRNELQINDADFGDDGEYMSPNRIFNLYKSKEFIFAISNSFYENSKSITQIECKPVDSDSEYSKMRLSVEDKSKKVHSFKIYSKDGSRYTMDFLSHKKNVDLNGDNFSFDISKFENIIVEDLRF